MTQLVSRRPKIISPRFLWLPLLAGPVIGATYFFIGYYALEAICQGAGGTLYLVSSYSLPFFMLIWSLTALWMAFYANYFAYQSWRQLKSYRARQQGWQAQHQKMALAGLVMSLCCTGFILTLGLLPVFWLRPCF